MIPIPRNSLVSFHYFKDFNLDETPHLRLIGDSGAYSAHTQNSSINIDDLNTWHRKWAHRLAWAASLDVIGNQNASRDNWKQTTLLGLQPVPTIHYGAPPEALDYYVRQGVDFIGLGGLVGGGAVTNLRWMLAMFRYARDAWPHIKFHAVQAIAAHLNAPLHILETDVLAKIGGSSLLTNGNIASGEAGAEFAHEWCPARNLVLASLATAMAEAHGYTAIALGNNLEESGAYPDNEQAFIHALNTVMPNAVADGKHVRFIQPVGNLMKHQIVSLGLKVNAPLHLTWSCYKDGPKHCGDCGPCYMRRKAFTMNNATDPVEYAQ